LAKKSVSEALRHPVESALLLFRHAGVESTKTNAVPRFMSVAVVTTSSLSRPPLDADHS
jgi:hypothetical protein